MIQLGIVSVFQGEQRKQPTSAQSLEAKGHGFISWMEVAKNMETTWKHQET